VLSITVVPEDIESVPRALAQLERALDDEFEKAYEAISWKVAEIANATHAYQNRSGKLEEQTIGTPASGSLSDGTLQTAVVANRPYASFVERKLPFIAPAVEMADPYMVREAEDAFERAVRRVSR
jgi:hypothetical protein